MKDKTKNERIDGQKTAKKTIAAGRDTSGWARQASEVEEEKNIGRKDGRDRRAEAVDGLPVSVRTVTMPTMCAPAWLQKAASLVPTTPGTAANALASALGPRSSSGAWSSSWPCGGGQTRRNMGAIVGPGLHF
eukprot:6174029-Pleurochrysis_carterae.AAC.8